jgi:uncharacterized protein RhaS with RHS repeats
MRARHYSPEFGRFLQPDPSRLETNHYGYAGNGPAANIDPDGTWKKLCMCGALGGGVRLLARFESRAAARASLAKAKTPVMQAAYRFAKGAPANSRSIRVIKVKSGRYEISAWSPAANQGYGKMYKVVVNGQGKVIVRLKYNWNSRTKTASKIEHY